MTMLPDIVDRLDDLIKYLQPLSAQLCEIHKELKSIRMQKLTEGQPASNQEQCEKCA